MLAADWPAGATRSVKGHAIPQVPHTYAYHTEGYAAMNEHQVGLAESTCSGRRFPPTNATRSGFMDIVQLGQLGLERSNTSRSAVRTMGALAEQWGYSDATESLLVIDPHSPGEYRANGAAINHDGFHQAFGTKEGDKMFKPSDERIRIW